MTKHTPGPWQSVSAIIENASNRAIVKVAKWGGPTIADCGPDVLQNEANARLIAAAPALLEALREITTKAESMNAWQHSGNTNTPEDWSTLYQLTNEARAVLAKLNA